MRTKVSEGKFKTRKAKIGPSKELLTRCLRVFWANRTQWSASVQWRCFALPGLGAPPGVVRVRVRHHVNAASRACGQQIAACDSRLFARRQQGQFRGGHRHVLPAPGLAARACSRVPRHTPVSPSATRSAARRLRVDPQLKRGPCTRCREITQASKRRPDETDQLARISDAESLTDRSTPS